MTSSRYPSRDAPGLASVRGTVERITPGGQGLLRSAEGVVFVPGALPGEEVELLVVERRGGTLHAADFVLLKPSPHRMAAVDCALHPACGGCDLLHVDAEGRRTALRAMVVDALCRVGGYERIIEDRVAGVRSPAGAEGRRRARVHVGPNGAVGFFRRRSNELVPAASCPALAPALAEAYERLSARCPLPAGASVRLAVDDRGHVSAALEGLPRRLQGSLVRAMVDEGLVTGALIVDREGEVVAEAGDPVLLGEVAPGDAGGPYRSCAATFTQATRFGATAISEEVVASVAGREVGEGYVLELFAGAGHLTFPLARWAKELVAVEGAARSAGWLRKNLDQSGLGNVRCVLGDIDGDATSTLLEGQLEAFPDVVVADPPRTGIPRFAGMLEVLAPAVLVLVSCDLATGARDLAVARTFGYALERLTPIDSFPRTSHVEWVAVLVGQELVGQEEA